RLVLGTEVYPTPRFEVAPMLSVLCERLGLPLPSLERRKARALATRAAVPSMHDDGPCYFVRVGGRPFFCLRTGAVQTGWFYAPGALASALVARAALPE